MKHYITILFLICGFYLFADNVEQKNNCALSYETMNCWKSTDSNISENIENNFLLIQEGNELIISFVGYVLIYDVRGQIIKEDFSIEKQILQIELPKGIYFICRKTNAIVNKVFVK